MQKFFKPVIAVLTVATAIGSVQAIGQVLVKPDVKVEVKPEVKTESRIGESRPGVLAPKSEVALRQDIAAGLANRPVALRTQATILVLAAGMASLDLATRNASQAAYSFIADPNSNPFEAKQLADKLNKIGPANVDGSMSAAVAGFFTTKSAPANDNKPVAAQAEQTTCTVEAFLSEYTNGLPGNIASMFKADLATSKADTGSFTVVPGNCGQGSSSYGVTAKTNLAWVLHGMATAHKYDINALQNSYKVTMNTSDETAKTTANDFVNGCKIVQVK